MLPFAFSSFQVFAAAGPDSGVHERTGASADGFLRVLISCLCPVKLLLSDVPAARKSRASAMPSALSKRTGLRAVGIAVYARLNPCVTS